LKNGKLDLEKAWESLQSWTGHARYATNKIDEDVIKKCDWIYENIERRNWSYDGQKRDNPDCVNNYNYNNANISTE
jgi:hypothetical protein